MGLDAALVSARAAFLRTAMSSDLVSTGQLTAISARLTDSRDEVSRAIDGLIHDHLIRAAATQRRMTTEIDASRQIRLTVAAPLGDELQWLTLADPGSAPDGRTSEWPQPAPAEASVPDRSARRLDASERVASAIAHGESLDDIASGLRGAGWSVAIGKDWIPAAGAAAPLPDAIITAARQPGVAPGAVLGPVVDPVHGVVAVAILTRDGPGLAEPAIASAIVGIVDSTTLRHWAEARALEAELHDALNEEWSKEPQAQVRAAELVVGSSDVQGSTGDYVSLAHLVVKQLPSDVGNAPVLATELRGLSPVARTTRFANLVDQANKAPTDDPLLRSGELGYYTKDQLIPEISTVAFEPTVVTGSVLGPIHTVAGDELFMVRSRFSGALDERSGAALVEARSAADLAALAGRISPPGDAPRAAGTLWRAQDEFAGNAQAKRAFGETAIGQLSDPFVFGGQIIVIRPMERRTSDLDPDALARLAVGGFDEWLEGERNAASIIIDPEPLPGVGGPSPTASPTDSGPPADGAPGPSGLLPRPSSSLTPVGLPTFRIVP
jgi:hypothetical protein